MSRILDHSFRYTPSVATNVVQTWKRFGYRPTTVAERDARQHRQSKVVPIRSIQKEQQQ